MSAWEILNEYGQHLSRVLLYGPPGTGKTHLAQAAGLKPDQAVYRIICTEDTPMAELRGHWVPRGSVWEWHDGPAMLAYRHGGRLVVDEITRATDDALSFLLAVLDGHPITLPSGETVYPHEDLSVWATTNATPAALTDALADRFVVRVRCDTINPAAIAALARDLRPVVNTSKEEGVSLREANEFQRLRAIMDGDKAASLIWEARGGDVMYAVKTAAARIERQERAAAVVAARQKADAEREARVQAAHERTAKRERERIEDEKAQAELARLLSPLSDDEKVRKAMETD